MDPEPLGPPLPERRMRQIEAAILLYLAIEPVPADLEEPAE